MASAWIGVDLDGTLAYYDGWNGVTHIGDPIRPMVDRVKAWLRDGKDVRIFTARVSPVNRDRDQIWLAEREIRSWCARHIGEVLPITCSKDMAMTEYYDDRAVQVEANTGLIVGYSTRGNV